MKDEFVQFAQKAIIIKDGKILLIKKSANDINQPNKWDLPGGRKQQNESLDEQIKREVFEEVGLKISPKNIFDMWQFSILQEEKLINVVAVSRFCDITESYVELTEDIISKYEWVTIDNNLLKYDFIPGIRQTIEKLILKQHN